METSCNLSEEVPISLKETAEKLNAISKKFDCIEKEIKKLNFEELFSKVKDVESLLNKSLEVSDELFEMRRATLATLEKLKSMEQKLPKELESLGLLEKKVENTEKVLLDSLKDLKKRVISLENEKKLVIDSLKKEVKELEESLREDVKKIEDNFEKEVRKELKEAITKHADMLSIITKRYTELSGKVEKIEKEELPFLLDKEITRIIETFGKKLSDVITREEFEKFKLNLEEKVENIRAPSVELLENKIRKLESKIENIEKLLMSISQRLPIVVE